MTSPFEKYQAKAWPYWYKGQMVVSQICGGVPADENTAESWIKAKLKDTRSEAEVKKLVEQTKAEIRQTHAAARLAINEGDPDTATDLLVVEDLGVDADALLEEITEDALAEMAVGKAAKDLAGLNMFKKTEEGVMYIEGRQLKAALKEAVAVAANAGKITTKGWGKPDNASYKKGIKSWFPEHVFVVDDILPLYREDGAPIYKPDETLQKFVHTHRGDAISYEECVRNAVIRFRVKTDCDLTEEQWAMVWLTGQDQGLGASRSQGFGTYRVTDWQKFRG
jgi:hypothetical protein